MRSAPLKFGTLLCLAACLVVTACVTINVYFPAAAAEKAADKIIDEVWQLKQQEQQQQQSAPAPAAPTQP